jgi:Sulfatase-modifying factor enzyme 1
MKWIFVFLVPILCFFVMPAVAISKATAPLTYEQRLRDAEFAGDENAKKTICQEWYASGDYSLGLLYWNYNALMSVEQNALLITQSETDTYPLWLLQYAVGVRKDVQTANLSHLENLGYRTSWLSRRGLQPMEMSLTQTAVLQQLLSQQTQNPVYIGILVPKMLWQTRQDQLFLTGLAFKYSTGSFDNLAALRENFEQKFFIDNLQINLFKEKDPSVLVALNLNYIPALLLLQQNYNQLGESEKADMIAQLALNLARQANREAEVQSLLVSKTSDYPIVKFDFPIKAYDKTMKKVADNLYASECETMIGDYELFLQYLLKAKAFGLIDTCKSAATNWRSLLPKDKAALPDLAIYKHGQPDAPRMPVQNISHEAARQYCAWLTQQYNAFAGKKKYKKVLFRLPTETEWELAAKGKEKATVYPWNTQSCKNPKGCYLGNFFVTDACEDCPAGESGDGGFFPVFADAYFPNDLGLYNTCGNVAEMVANPGVARGGSWQETPENSTIQSRVSYTQPNPSIGFRVFMDVIEE